VAVAVAALHWQWLLWHLPSRDGPQLEQKMAHEGRFAGVNVANHDQVQAGSGSGWQWLAVDVAVVVAGGDTVAVARWQCGRWMGGSVAVWQVKEWR
jgi:hypothetical protein